MNKEQANEKMKIQMTEEQAKEFIEILIDELEKEVESLKKRLREEE